MLCHPGNDHHHARQWKLRLKWSESVLAVVVCISTIIFCANGRAKDIDSVSILSVVVDGKPLSLPQNGSLNLGLFPKNISFGFGSDNPSVPPPLRLRARLEGFENIWHVGQGYMFLAIRFFDNAGDQIDQQAFPVTGESAGWDGSLKTSPLTHRRETVIVPPKAAQAWVVISSAGPPSTVGIYVIANLVMSKVTTNPIPVILVQSPFNGQLNDHSSHKPANWAQDGTHLSMAKTIEIGQYPPTRAFAIEDDDPNAHAEWHSVRESAPAVTPGDCLVVEWNEMFSIGVGDLRSVSYPELPPGNYQFHVDGVSLLGEPDGAEASLKVFVPEPLWKRPLFWTVMAVFVTAIIVGGIRYIVWDKMRREMLLLRSQRAMESERLRIARDIHDDLGARITQISMVSASSLHDPDLSDKTRTELSQIKQMSRDLVSALYETVWTVNPEYDNLDSLGNYLCQMINQLCTQSSLQCRLRVSDLPRGIQVSSHIRHNITMVIKEAIHNTIKHAQASEVTVHMAFINEILDISVKDNGCGFQPAGNRPGNGLTNMKQRMKDIGGSCTIDSKLESGTTVHLSFPIDHNTTPPIVSTP